MLDFKKIKDIVATFAQRLGWKPHFENPDRGKPALCFDFSGEGRKRLCSKFFRV